MGKPLSNKSKNAVNRMVQLLKDGERINIGELEKETGVSRQFLYKLKPRAEKIARLFKLKLSLPKKEAAIETAPAPVTTNEWQVGGSHYKDKAIQPWDYIASNNLGYLEGNVVKYVSRWREKAGMQDLLKAKHYLEKLIELHGK